MRPRTTWIWLLSFTLLMIHVVMTVVAGQTANIAFLSTTTEFHAPYLFVFFKTLFRGAAFPVYITINTMIKLARGRKLDLGRTWRWRLLILHMELTICDIILWLWSICLQAMCISSRTEDYMESHLHQVCTNHCHDNHPSSLIRIGVS